MAVWNVLQGIDFLCNQRKCINKTRRTLSGRDMFLSGRQQEAVLKQSCRTELSQSSHFDLQSAHFGDRRELNPIGTVAGTLFHSAFFSFVVISKLRQGGIVINLQVLPFLHFPCGAWGKRKGHGGIEMAVRHATGGMNVCMQWDFDTGKRLLDAELTHKSLYDMVITLLSG